ncbi:hypothetical protein HF086_002537 [Spodoptera exigua]|uniref:Uncharacterized protein n=1 Tax=Spodoptera exigua TaxID=7107 RepID=A0A922M4I9_SPOEX|nr:hypothetical protein HF086_002537 [Spodoptera exigua]
MMQSTSEGCMNIAELANQLRREKIFINSERQLLQKLNEDVEKRALELLQVAWICLQQRQNLTNLITSRCDADSIAYCQRASHLERAIFVDAFKVLKYKEATALGELLGWLRESPHLVSLCLLLGEDNIPPSLPVALMSGLYGSCRSASDRTRFLAVIRSLIKHQMAPSSDPRKFFRTGKCALSSLYAVYRDGHTPARQFLVAVLQNPVMAVLHEDEFFLDIDPDKAMERFSPADRTKKFGQPNSQEYAAKVARYRKWTIQSLYNLTTKFIVALREHWPNFPSTIAWIVQQIVHLLKQHSRTSEREVHAICTDLIMNHFICPAIVNPEAHGVVEVPVSYIARFNLIQIAQIIQMLCLAKFQEVDAKVRDVYLKFERSCVWTLIDNVTSEAWSCAPTPAQPHAHAETPRVATDAYLHTTVALFTPHDAQLLITFLRRISSKLNNNTPSVTSDEQPSGSAVAEAAALSSETSSESSSNGEACASRLAALLQTSEPNYRSRLHDLLKKMPDLSKYRPTSPPESKDPSPVENGHSSKRSILAKVQRPRLPRSASSNSSLASASLVPESKVLECYYGGSEAGDADENGSALAVAGPGAPVQKRTRFSVSHDEVSLGNTSDNLEAVSEAASNHSVTSSLELETEDQNDNLSDMNAPDASETASESAWSMDVLASDSDRNTEVMTCYATSAPESPSTSAPVALPGDLFDYVPPNNGPQTESTLDANSQSDATSQWVDDSFPAPHHSPERPYPSTSKYDLPSTSKPYPENDMMDQSLNSSESSFNAMYGGRFDSGIDAERAESESRSAITDLMTRMSSATISTSANLVNNITSRIVKSEIRTSIVSISSSKIEKKREGTSNMSLSTLSVNSAETSASDKSSSQDVNSDIVTERRVSPPPIKNVSTGAIPKSISFDATAEKSQRRRIGEDGLVGNLDELKNNVKRSGGNLLHKIKMFRQKGRSHTHHNGEDHNVKLAEEEARSDDGSRPELAAGESSEEILAKYRRKCSTESTGSKHKRSQRRISDVPDAEMDRSEGVVDLNDPEVFNSMKRKLRIVLSNPDLHCVEFVPNTDRADPRGVVVVRSRGGGGARAGPAGPRRRAAQARQEAPCTSTAARVLSEHIRRVSSVTSARSLGVPAAHRWAAPYPRAQRHLRHLAVYRTPRDKLSCIMRCVTSIMAVLGLTEGSTPSADDLTPVLVYVILKVNPPSLLSTIELVNALGGSALQGEALYWWTQFCAAVAYIKTMDYPRPDNNDT